MPAASPTKVARQAPRRVTLLPEIRGRTTPNVRIAARSADCTRLHAQRADGIAGDGRRLGPEHADADNRWR